MIPVFAASKAADLNNRFSRGELPYITYPVEDFLGEVKERIVLPVVRRPSHPIIKAKTALTLSAKELATSYGCAPRRRLIVKTAEVCAATAVMAAVDQVVHALVPHCPGKVCSAYRPRHDKP